MSNEFTIEDLSKHSGLSIRTLHYYMQIGLLPSPEKSGKYASYSQEHLDRLDLILILRDMHLPLKEIGEILSRLTPSDIVHYRDYQEELQEKIKGLKPESEEKDQFKDQNKTFNYFKNLNKANIPNKIIADNQFFPYQKDQITLFDNKLIFKFFNEPTDPEQQKWRRIVLHDGVELHIRDTQDKEVIHKIERLLSFARSLFEKSDSSKLSDDKQG